MCKLKLSIKLTNKNQLIILLDVLIFNNKVQKQNSNTFIKYSTQVD